MNILIDLLHLIAAAALSVIGFGYEREPDCNPVRFQPAAMVETVEVENSDPALQSIADCERDAATVRLPAL